MMKKRLLSVVCLALTAVGCCALGACEDADVQGLVADVQGLVYEKIGGKEEYRVTNTFMEPGITNITIPDIYLGLPVTEIGSFAFDGCDSLTSVVIPDSVTTIDYFAFEGCSSLTSVVIPDGVTTIDDWAFYECSSLTSVVIGDSVTSIGDMAFWKCSSLTSVYITDIEAWCNISFGSSEANPLCYAKNLYLNNELVTELIIPEGVTSIGNWAFYECSSLTSVVIPDSVTSIGSHAFRNCDSLSVYITNIEAWCNISFSDFDANPFYYAGNLYLNNELVTELIIPEGATSIGYTTFRNCSSLTSVVIPDSVTKIGEDAFEGCRSLTSVYYKGTASEWENISIGDWNHYLTDATRYYYDESETTESWWHYDENGNVVHA